MEMVSRRRGAKSDLSICAIYTIEDPKKRGVGFEKDLAGLGMRAIVAGSLATFLTGTIAGLISP